jgi:hypothetical protein
MPRQNGYYWVRYRTVDEIGSWQVEEYEDRTWDFEDQWFTDDEMKAMDYEICDKRIPTPDEA